MTSRAKWFLRARPGDFMLALSDAMASLPVVGQRLEPLGGVTAMALWGYRMVPEFVSASAKSWLTPRCAAWCQPRTSTSNGPRQNALHRYGVR